MRRGELFCEKLRRRESEVRTIVVLAMLDLAFPGLQSKILLARTFVTGAHLVLLE